MLASAQPEMSNQVHTFVPRAIVKPVVLMCLLLVAPQCFQAQRLTPANKSAITFEDVTLASGINWTHNNAHSSERHLPETVGAGCAFLDYDNDGWLDIFLVNSGPSDFFAPAAPIRHAMIHSSKRSRIFTLTPPAPPGATLAARRLRPTA